MSCRSRERPSTIWPLQENAAALESQTLQEYNANTTWYAAAYGVNMQAGHQAGVLPLLRAQSAPLAAPVPDDALEKLRYGVGAFVLYSSDEGARTTSRCRRISAADTALHPDKTCPSRAPKHSESPGS